MGLCDLRYFGTRINANKSDSIQTILTAQFVLSAQIEVDLHNHGEFNMGVQHLPARKFNKH